MQGMQRKVASMTTKQLKEELTHESGEGVRLTDRIIIARACELAKLSQAHGRVAVALSEVLEERNR